MDLSIYKSGDDLPSGIRSVLPGRSKHNIVFTERNGVFIQ
jgi:cation transport regulator ChaB